MDAFSEALAQESLQDELEQLNIPTEYLVQVARTVAYKVFHNPKQGNSMSKEDDPLTVNGVPAPQSGTEIEHYATDNDQIGD